MNHSKPETFSDRQWLEVNTFEALSEIAWLLEQDANSGRDRLIRALEHTDIFKPHDRILESLIQKAGLFPYLSNHEQLSTAELLSIEFHKPDGLDDIVLHSMQGKVYRALMDGANVILSAPTSFGKSLLIDAMIASRKFQSIVVIVPTIALIDETRRRLSKRFSTEFKIITHPSQAAAEKNIYVLTQERFIEFDTITAPDFFVVDEFYKLSPNRGDERTFVLNHAFYKLLKSEAQFFLIGPNIQDITIDETQLNFRYFGTDFSTVATEIKFLYAGDSQMNALELCKSIDEPTLIFCKSSASAYKLAEYLILNGVKSPNKSVIGFSEWLRDNYHKQWILADLLEAGIAVHHGSLPRSIAYHLLRKFNEGSIKFLICTSTIIEGVNTVAKNIIIYDNKIATKKFDQFTFNNIKGRAGRMLQHFVGHVYVLHQAPQQELPLVDVPSVTQPDDAPESLLIQMDEYDLSEHSIEKLRYLHAQDILPVEIMRENAGLSPENQLDLAKEITLNLKQYHDLLAWNRFPDYDQLQTVCALIYDYLMGGTGRDGIFSAKQLLFKMSRLMQLKNMRRLIEAELKDHKQSPTEAVEEVLMFLRRWGEYNFPRYLNAFNNIQKSVFEKAGLRPGDYTAYCTSVKQLFMPLAATALEEYGLPYQLTMRIESKCPLGDDVDTILETLHKVNLSALSLSEFEQELIKDAMANI